MTSCFPDIGL